MALDMAAHRSRRALLASAIGAGIASVAAALGRPDVVRAGTDGDVVLGVDNPATTTTTITNSANTTTVLAATSTSSGNAIVGTTTSGVGVEGVSTNGAGVIGTSQTNAGVLGASRDAARPGMLGVSLGNATGVAGASFPLGSPTPTFPLVTGVFGYATQNAGSHGVYGQTTAGQGVRGEATTGTGGYFTASPGTALQVAGKASFSRSGRVSIAAGRSSVDVDVRAKGGLGGAPLLFANLMAFRSGVWVAAVRPNYPVSGKLRIYLNKPVPAATYVSWLVLG